MTTVDVNQMLCSKYLIQMITEHFLLYVGINGIPWFISFRQFKLSGWNRPIISLSTWQSFLALVADAVGFARVERIK